MLLRYWSEITVVLLYIIIWWSTFLACTLFSSCFLLFYLSLQSFNFDFSIISLSLPVSYQSLNLKQWTCERTHHTLTWHLKWSHPPTPPGPRSSCSVCQSDTVCGKKLVWQISPKDHAMCSISLLSLLSLLLHNLAQHMKTWTWILAVCIFRCCRGVKLFAQWKTITPPKYNSDWSAKSICCWQVIQHITFSLKKNFRDHVRDLVKFCLFFWATTLKLFTNSSHPKPLSKSQ